MKQSLQALIFRWSFNTAELRTAAKEHHAWTVIILFILMDIIIITKNRIKFGLVVKLVASLYL